MQKVKGLKGIYTSPFVLQVQLRLEELSGLLKSPRSRTRIRTQGPVVQLSALPRNPPLLLLIYCHKHVCRAWHVPQTVLFGDTMINKLQRPSSCLPGVCGPVQSDISPVVPTFFTPFATEHLACNSIASACQFHFWVPESSAKGKLKPRG